MGLVITGLHLLLTLILLEEPRGVEEVEQREGKEERKVQREEEREQSPDCSPVEGNATDTCVGRVTSIQVKESLVGDGYEAHMCSP